MYLVKTLTGAEMESCAVKDPFGPRLQQEDLDGAVRLEIWGSSFKDPGDDFCEFVLFSSAGTELRRVRREGY